MNEEYAQALADFIATRNAKPDLTPEEMAVKFPEFNSPEMLQAAYDYEATSKSGKYTDPEELNSKFPEFFGEKKNPNETLPEQGGDSNLEDGSSVSQNAEPPTIELYEFDGEMVTKEYLEGFGIPVPQDPAVTKGESKTVGQGKLEPNEYSKALGSGISTVGRGIVGLPANLAEMDWATQNSLKRLFLSGKEQEDFDKTVAEIQELPDEQRTQAILELQGENSNSNKLFGIDVSNFTKQSDKLSRKFKEEQAKIDKTRKEYETNIIDDIVNVNLGQASERIATGIVESLPYMALTLMGGAGLATMGASTASNKMDDLESQGEDVDLKMGLVSGLRGGAEVLGGKVLQKLFAPALGKLSGDAADEVSGDILKRVAKAFGTEFLEEGSQSLQEEITDLLAYAKSGTEVDWVGMFKRFIDSGLIGGFSAAPAGVFKGGKKQTETTNTKDTKTVENQPVPLNIPALDDSGQPVENPTIEGDGSTIVEQSPVDTETTTTEPDGTPLRKTKGKTVGDVLNTEVRINSIGNEQFTRPVKGDIYEENNRVILDTRDGKQYDLGNVDEIGNTDISDIQEFSITAEQSMVTANVEGDIEYKGNTFAKPKSVDKVTKKNAAGEITSVKLKPKNGGKAVTLRGQEAVDAFYVTKLAELEVDSQADRVDSKIASEIEVEYEKLDKNGKETKQPKPRQQAVADGQVQATTEGQADANTEQVQEQGGQVEQPTESVTEPNAPVEPAEPYQPEPEAQGLFGTKPEDERDSSLSDGGAVGVKGRNRKRFARFWKKTFSSDQGVSQPIVRTMEKNKGRVSSLNQMLKQDASIFNDIIGKVKDKYGRKSLKVGGRVIKTLKRADRKDLNTALKAINEYLTGNKEADVSFLEKEDIQELDNLRSNIDQKSRQIIYELRVMQQEIQQQMESDPDNTALYQARLDANLALQQTLEGNLGKYMYRSYDAFSKENYIEDMMSSDRNQEAKRRFDNAVDFVMEDMNLSRAEAKEVILEYLNSIKNKENFLATRIDGKIKAPFLKKRKNIPEPIQELLGVSKDPVKNYVTTMYNAGNYLSSIVYQRELRDILMKTGIGKTTIEDGHVGFKSNNQGWDFLEGLYVPKDFADAMKDFQGLDPINTEWARWLVAAAGITKVGKTVYSPITTARNFLSGTLLSLNAGFLPFTDKNTAKAFIISWGGDGARNKYKEESDKLITLGVVNDGVISGEILAIMNDMTKSIDRLTDTSVLNRLMDTMQKIYAMGDDAYKVMGFYTYKDRYMKAGETEARAEELAARRIRNGFPTYSKLPINIQHLRRFPLVGTFPSFAYEVWRTNWNNLKFVADDINTYRRTGNKEYAKMAAKQATGTIVATVLGTALGSLSKSLLGISDEEEESAKNMSPAYQADAKLLFFNRGDGFVEFIDLTAFLPQEVIIRPWRILTEEREGRDFADKLGLAADAATSAFLGADIMVSTLTEVFMNKSSYGGKIYEGDNILDGLSNNSGKVVDYILSNAGIGYYSNVKEFARANADHLPPYITDYFGQKRSKYKEYTMEEAGLALVGFRLSKVDYTKGTVNLAVEARTGFADKRTSVLRKIRQGIDRTGQIDELVQGENEYNQEEYKKTIVAIGGYQNMGMKGDRLIEALRTESFSQKDVAALYFAGVVPPLKEISKSQVSKEITKMKMNNYERTAEDRARNQKEGNFIIKNAVAFNNKTAETNQRNMAVWIRDNFGDDFIERRKENKLTSSEKSLLAAVSKFGLLEEKPNKGLVNNYFKQKTYTAIEEYKKLINK